MGRDASRPYISNQKGDDSGNIYRTIAGKGDASGRPLLPLLLHPDPVAHFGHHGEAGDDFQGFADVFFEGLVGDPDDFRGRDAIHLVPWLSRQRKRALT